MSIPSINVLRRLIYVIGHLVVNQYLPLDQVIINGHLNANGLRNLETILIQIQRQDVLKILHETMTGNNTLLEQHEQFLRFRDQFHLNGYNHVGLDWPAFFYRFTLNNIKPVRQENMNGGRTANNNIITQETQDQNDEANDNESGRHAQTRSRDPALSHRRIHHSNHQQGETRDPRTSTSGTNLRKSPWSVREESPFRPPQLPLRRSYLAQPSVPLGSTSHEEPRNPQADRAQCCNCGKNIQAMQNTPPVWQRVTDIIRDLNLPQLQAFITEVNNHTGGILDICTQITNTPSYLIVAAFIVRPLQRYHPHGENSKCVLCLLNFALQRIGRGDLADQVKQIRFQFG